jgi:hypothetical protein
MRNSDQIKQKLEWQDASSFYSHSFQKHTHREWKKRHLFASSEPAEGRASGREGRHITRTLTQGQYSCHLHSLFSQPTECEQNHLPPKGFHPFPWLDASIEVINHPLALKKHPHSCKFTRSNQQNTSNIKRIHCWFTLQKVHFHRRFYLYHYWWLLFSSQSIKIYCLSN